MSVFDLTALGKRIIHLWNEGKEKAKAKDKDMDKDKDKLRKK